jgi:MFS family permease
VLLVLKQSWALMLGMLLLMLGNGLQGSLLGVRGSLDGINSATLGLVMSAYFIGFLAGSWYSPVMLRRVGHVRVFAALGSLASAAFILYAVYVDPLSWFVLRLVVGFCFSGIYVVAESWLNHSATNETRGQTLSMYLIVQMSGMVLGQLLLNAADPSGYNLFVLISVLVSISFAPILLSTSPTPQHDAARSMTLRRLIAVSPLACVGMFLLGGVFSALFAMSSVYATAIGLSVASTSAFITAIFLGGLTLQYPIGWLSDRIDRRWLIIAAAGVGMLTCIVAPFVGAQLQWLIACAFVIGGIASPMYGLLLAYANDYLDVEDMPSASSGLLFINGSGAVAGPVIVGRAMETAGPASFFVIIGVLYACIAAYALWRMTQREHIVVDSPAPYVAVTSRTSAFATGIAVELADEAQLEALEEADEDLEYRHSDEDPPAAG